MQVRNDCFVPDGCNRLKVNDMEIYRAMREKDRRERGRGGEREGGKRDKEIGDADREREKERERERERQVEKRR